MCYTISFLSLTHVISTLKLKFYSKMFRRKKRKNFDFNCDRWRRACRLFCIFFLLLFFRGKFACFFSTNRIICYPYDECVIWIMAKMCTMNGTFRKKIRKGMKWQERKTFSPLFSQKLFMGIKVLVKEVFRLSIYEPHVIWQNIFPIVYLGFIVYEFFRGYLLTTMMGKIFYFKKYLKKIQIFLKNNIKLNLERNF